jgi:proliferating cell nuclear antigen PCNA
MTNEEKTLLMKMVTVECRPFKSLTDAMKDCVGDVNMVFTPDAIRTTAIDHNQTVIVDLQLEGDKLLEYYCHEAPKGKRGPLVLGISINNLHKIIKTAQNTSDDVISISYYEDASDIVINISSKNRAEERIFELPLIEHDNIFEEDLDASTREYPYILSMPCGDFQKICRDLKGTEVNKVQIQYSGGILSFNGIGGLGGRILRKGADIGEDETQQVIVRKEPESELATYSESFKLTSLLNLIKCSQSGTKDVVQICMQPGSPIIFTFNVGSFGKIRFGLAPYDEGAK